MRGEKRDVEAWENNFQELAPVSLGKLHGSYGSMQTVGPDPFYKLHILKDESKANKTNRNEAIGVTQHKNPLLCAVNATATYLLLRYGRDGITGLPDFIDAENNWTGETHMFCRHDGTGMLSYNDHSALFTDMKQASGLENLMDTRTKLQSFGAMQANENQASHEETERAGRCPTTTAISTTTTNYHYRYHYHYHYPH